MFTLGSFSWFAAMLIWDYNELITGQITPFPGLSDVGFLAYAVFFSVGFFFYRADSPTAKVSLRKIAGIGTIICAFIIAFVIVFAEDIVSGGFGTLYLVTAISWPVFYITAAISATYSIMLVTSRQHISILYFLFASIVLQTVIAIQYAATLLDFEYQAGSYLDVFWLVALALDFFSASKQLHGRQAAEPPSENRDQTLTNTVDALTTIGAMIAISVVLFIKIDSIDTTILQIILVISLFLFLFLCLREWAERKVHQELLAARGRALGALHRSENRFRDFAETASDWFWEMDENLRFTYFSSRFEHSGIDFDERLGKTRAEMTTEDTSQSNWRQHFADLDTRKPFKNFEHTTRARNGSRVHVSISGVPIYDEAGNFEGYRGTGTDITERKQADQNIHKMNEDLERRVEERSAELRAAQDTLLRNERLSTLGQLTATVSHELRNPLGVIRTSAFTLRNAVEDGGPHAKRALERIERTVVRCDRIIDELLDFTRISDLEPKPMPIDSWLGDVLMEQNPPQEIQINWEPGLTDTSVAFDSDRLRRAVINIFDNACQALTGSGNERPGEHSLTVRSLRKAGRVELHFDDSGPGIPPNLREKVFEPLFSTKGFGVGLGLPVVMQIMEQHGGGIEIESEEGRGTKVCLWLPNR